MAILGLAGIYYLSTKKMQGSPLPSSSDVAGIFKDFTTFSPLENLPASTLATAQGKTTKEFFQTAAFGQQEYDRQLRVSSLPTGAGRNVQVQLIPAPESRMNERSGVNIPNPVTGKLQDSRQVFLQSFGVTGITRTTSPAGTLSKQPSRNPTGSVRRSSLSGSVR